LSGGEYLRKNNIVGIEGVDVRALTKILRDSGVMMGMITTEHSREDGLRVLEELARLRFRHYAREVSTQRAYQWHLEGVNGRSRNGKCRSMHRRASWCSIMAPSSTSCAACASAGWKLLSSPAPPAKKKS
jgi:hypothetical protein